MPSTRRFLGDKERRRVDYIFNSLAREVGGDIQEHDLEFLTSTQTQFTKDGKLSDKQIEVLEKIYKKYQDRTLEGDDDTRS